MRKSVKIAGKKKDFRLIISVLYLIYEKIQLENQFGREEDEKKNDI